MTAPFDKASAAVESAVRALRLAGKPLKPRRGTNSKMPQACSSVSHERMIERVYNLGPRPLAELLAEIAIATGEPDLIADCVEAYAGLDPEIVRALGADRFPPIPLVAVR